MGNRHQSAARKAAITGGGEERRAHARAIEFFHLAFMQVAATHLRPDDFAVKGGGNLRFFLRSGRRSADLDLDYLGGNFTTFGDRVDGLMNGRPIVRLLQLHDITFADLSRGKNTET